MSDALKPKFLLPLDGSRLPESVQKFLLSKALSGESPQQVIVETLERAAAKSGFKVTGETKPQTKPQA